MASAAPESPEPTPAADSDFHAVLVRCLERYPDEGSAAVDALCREQPQHADELRLRVAKLLDIGVLTEDERGDEHLPERLGEFRVLRLLGSGGMGVVYLARQDGLERDVVLKLIRPEQLYFPGMRERFRREVETVARLQHPGVVPILTVGESDGVPYFAMERVRGRTLAEVIVALSHRSPAELTGREFAGALAEDGAPPPGELPRAFAGSWEAACLEVAEQVASTLEHVHRHGVIHRDVKPSNVMVTPEGRALLLDFGLASSSGATALTRTGSRLGSLPYLPPEQVRADAREPTPASDVYSLGVTLYELLTLVPPFPEESAHALLARIEEGRPRRVRHCNPAVSWETETVCLAAMDRDVERRYPTAAAFARDLASALEHRPIAARRASAALRARRLVERHPVAAGLALLCLLLLALVPLFLLVREREARQRIEEKTRLAEANFGKALAAVDAMLAEVAEFDLKELPRMEPVRRRLLERALAFYADFSTERPTDTALLRRTAAVQQQVGRIHLLLGDLAAAAAAFRDAIARLDLLPAELAAAPEAVRERARANRALAQALHGSGRGEEGFAAANAAVAALETGIRRELCTDEDRRELARSRYQVAALFSTRHAEAAMAALRQALPVLEEFADRVPPVAADAVMAASAWNALGALERNRAGSEEAVPALKEAVRRFDAIASAGGDDYELAQSQFSALFNLAGAAVRAPGEDPLAPLARARAIQERLAAEHPAVPEHRLQLARVDLVAADLARTRGDASGAAAAARASYEALDALEREFPAATEYARELARAAAMLSDAERALGEFTAARAHAERAVALERARIARDPGDVEAKFQFGRAAAAQLKAWLELGEVLPRVALLEEAARELGEAHRALGLEEIRERRGYFLFHLSDAHLQLGDPAAAADVAEQLAELGEPLGKSALDGAVLLARAARAAKSPAQAAEWRRRTLALLGRAVELGCSDPAPWNDATFGDLADTAEFRAVLERMRRE